jgi:DNA-directed RNA polymerase specialized sigma24 family protein
MALLLRIRMIFSRRSLSSYGILFRLLGREASVTTWLYRVSLNTAIKWTKKERKHYQSETIDGVKHLLEESRMTT